MSGEQTVHLATLFIDDRKIENELAFLEDLLHSIYNQVTPLGSADSATNMAYSEYRKCLHTGRRAAQRIRTVAEALRYRVKELADTGDAVLIIDHLDQCSPALRELIQGQLDILRDDGLKMLVTSRLPRHEPAVVVWCDYHPPDRPIQAFWRCSKCQKTDICSSCKKGQNICKKW